MCRMIQTKQNSHISNYLGDSHYYLPPTKDHKKNESIYETCQETEQFEDDTYLG